jgi:putative flippase GtrA
MKNRKHFFLGTVGKLMRFALVGLLVMCVFMALNWALGGLMTEQGAFLSAYPAALLLHFYLNKFWTFENYEKVNSRQLLAYAATVLVTFVIQWCIFTYCRRWTSWPAWIAAGVANVGQMTVSFFMLKLKVFVHRASKNGR